MLFLLQLMRKCTYLNVKLDAAILGISTLLWDTLLINLRWLRVHTAFSIYLCCFALSLSPNRFPLFRSVTSNHLLWITVRLYFWETYRSIVNKHETPLFFLTLKPEFLELINTSERSHDKLIYSTRI